MKPQIYNIIRLSKKHTYMESPEHYLDKLERNLYKIIYNDNTNEIAIETLAKFLYERKKYREALHQFRRLINLNDKKVGAIYGMYKCYAMLDDYENSYECINRYIELKKNAKLKSGAEIIVSAYEIILNNNKSIKISNTSSFIMNKIDDPDLKIKYIELVNSYNEEDYERCLSLVDECQDICKSKHLMIEFDTFKHILNKVNKQVRVINQVYIKN